MRLRAHLFVLIFSLAFLGYLITAHGQSEKTAWNIAVLDRIIASVKPGQTLAQAGDMQISVTSLQAWRNQLAGMPSPQLTFEGGVTLWPGGNVYYSFDTNVSAPKQKVFVDTAAEWAMFANLHFIPRTTQSNYVMVGDGFTGGGGGSVVGMAGVGAQPIVIGSAYWNHHVIAHELGHTLGLLHEQQRSDRDSYVTIVSNEIAQGYEGNFFKDPASQNPVPYDFLSVMHYRRNEWSIHGGDSNTIVPLPPYTHYMDIMGQQFDPVLSFGDRSGMAALYGPGPSLGPVVLNTQDSGPGSIRAAFYYAFDHPGTTITFNIPTNDPGFDGTAFTIRLSGQLPALFDSVVLDGSTEPVHSNPSGPSVVLAGGSDPANDIFVDGFYFRGSNCVARSLVINGMDYATLRMVGSNATANTISGCYLGTDPSGSLSVGTNSLYNVFLQGGAHGNTIGGTIPGSGNVLCGADYGIGIMDPGTSMNVIAGNHIGVNATGTTALPNSSAGIWMSYNAHSNVIGGSVPGARNVVSGNAGDGIQIFTDNNIVQGNYVGLNAAGTVAISNRSIGVIIEGSGNMIGGPSTGQGNVISGNGVSGVLILSSTNIAVQGNIIGLDASGNFAVPNVGPGLEISSFVTDNLVGGRVRSAANIISGNAGPGILLDFGSAGNVVEGNLIGLNSAGTAAVGNGSSGIEFSNSPTLNLIGGSSPGSRNFISGNAKGGVALFAGAVSNTVIGNTIGLDVSNAIPVPNLFGGVLLYGGAQSNQIGGIMPGAANLISGNGSNGVLVTNFSTIRNPIRGNSIFGNASNSIVLKSSGNMSQAAPLLTSATVSTNLTFTGSLTSVSNKTYHLDFYASPPGPDTNATRTYLGTVDATTTSNSPTVAFTNSLPVVVPAGYIVHATATDPVGNTSAVTNGIVVAAIDSVGDGIPDAWRAAHFGGPGTTTNSQSCATCDPDGDGLNNRQEFLAGTNPTNAASTLRLNAPALSGTNVTVGFDSVQGFTYRILSKDNLTNGFWSILEDQVIGPGGLFQITDPGAAILPKRFYRVEVFP